GCIGGRSVGAGPTFDLSPLPENAARFSDAEDTKKTKGEGRRTKDEGRRISGLPRYRYGRGLRRRITRRVRAQDGDRVDAAVPLRRALGTHEQRERPGNLPVGAEIAATGA